MRLKISDLVWLFPPVLAVQLSFCLDGFADDLGDSGGSTVPPLESTNPETNLQSQLKPFQLHTDLWQPLQTGSIFSEELKKTALQKMEASSQANFLQGGISKFSGQSPLNTTQRLLRPRILSGYTMMRPQTALPDLFQKLKADMAAVKPRLDAELDKARKEMDAELKHPLLEGKLQVPKFQALSVAKPADDLEAQLSRTKPMLDFEIEIARRKMEEELRLARLRKTPVVMGNGACEPMRNTKQMEDEILLARQRTEEQVAIAHRQLEAELARAKKIQAVPELSAEQMKLANARKEVEARIAKSKPELDAILTHMRASGTLSLPDSAEETVQGELSGQTVINWDKWYANFARLYEPRLLKFLKLAGDPEGSNTVSITVSNDQRIEVSLFKDDNPRFDRATLRAYKSLDRNAALAFPQGSHRQRVNFLIDNVHESSGPASAVKSKPFTGDREVHGFNWK